MEQPKFACPHPLGLPARYSHPVAELGSGSFGKVYLCALRCGAPAEAGHHGDPGDVQWVAVKLFKALGRCSCDEMKRLMREVLAQQKLEHNNVIGYREAGLTSCRGGLPTPASRLYLTLDYADGGTLKRLLAEHGRLPGDTARWFMRQLVCGLAYCHAQGVFNRDIKPDNLLLHSGGGGSLPTLKVADFGLCKRMEDSVPKSRVGSPSYMAPEVIQCGKPDTYDGRTADVFSCGVVLYKMVFGALPFCRSRADGRPLTFKSDHSEIMANMQADSWRELLPQQPAVCVSDSLLDLLAGMLRFDPKQRLSLLQVERHAWCREGLGVECVQLLRPDDADPAGGGEQQQAGQRAGDGPCSAVPAQSVASIEALFANALEHCWTFPDMRSISYDEATLEDAMAESCFLSLEGGRARGLEAASASGEEQTLI